MPPVRLARYADHPTGCPYPDGWLSYRRRRRAVEDDVSGGAPTTLPDDVLFGIFSRVSGFTDAARCAATCRRWGGAVATRAAPICRALPPPPPGGFLPHLAVGAFLQHQEKNDVSRRCAQLRFVPRLLQGPFAGGGAPARLLRQGGASFDDARPVASRNGRVVLELRHEERADGLTLCVWNHMTGDVAMAPTLSGKEFPGYDYACAILTGDDLDLDVPTGFFCLLLVYGRRGFTALRSFSSDTGRWGLEYKKPGAKMSGHLLRQLGPAVVLHGVAYWPMHRAALGVRFGSGSTAMDVCSVPYRNKFKLDDHVLGVSADGRLNLVRIGVIGAIGVPVITFSTSLLVLEDTTSVDDPSDELLDIKIALPQIKVTTTTPMKPWWFGERSGTLIFTVQEQEETNSTSAVFALNVATRSLEKLADDFFNTIDLSDQLYV